MAATRLSLGLLLFAAGLGAPAAATPQGGSAGDPVLEGCVPVAVHFGWGSARLTPAAERTLEALAVALAWKGPDIDHIQLTSHTDASGSPAANRALAWARARAVRDALVSRDVPARLIRMEALAAADPNVPTPPGVREPANRRVELLLQLTADAQADRLGEERPIC